MPLRFIRSRVSTNLDPLQVAISTTALAKDLFASLQFPPAIAAVSIVLFMLETVQGIQANQADCIALARRAAQILFDIGHQMQGRWDSAPERLVQNLQKFERTLKLIHDFMKGLAGAKWGTRFLRKSSIEDALAGYSRLMDDAAQSFQLATLIDLHYTIGTLSRKNTSADSAETPETAQLCIESPPPYKKKQTLDLSVQEPRLAVSTLSTIVGVPERTGSPTELSLSSQCEEQITEISTDGIRDTLDDQYLPEEMCSLSLESDHGFRRYHQSEIMLRGRSCIKEGKEGWWTGGMEVQVQGQPALIKRYDDPKAQASRKWLRDVKMLQSFFHPNLPQMLGFSDENAPSPFILLANVKTQTPEVTVREVLRTQSLARCMELMFRFYHDLTDTAMYVQRQLNLTDNQVHDFFEAAGLRVDSQKTLVVGLPPPREGKWYSARSYGLADTLLDACLKMLPNGGRVTHSYNECDEEVTEDMQKKINHLVTLARSLLPSDREAPGLPSKLQELIEDSDFETPSLTLRQVRDLTFNMGTHEHTWYERNVPACKFSVGDLGYIPQGKDWDSFVRLGNVNEDDPGALKVSYKAKGDHWSWEHLHAGQQPIQAFELPMNVSGWPVAVPPYKQIDVIVVHEAFVACVKDAWRYLLDKGKKIAQDAGVEPEDVVLVTKAGTYQDFYIKDFRPAPHGMSHHMVVTNPFQQHMHGFHQPGFGHPSFGQPSFGQPMLPSIVYLFTSFDPSHQPYWSSSPMCAMPGSERASLDRHFTYKIGYKSGFLNYVQLYAEDFEGLNG